MVVFETGERLIQECKAMERVKWSVDYLDIRQSPSTHTEVVPPLESNIDDLVKRIESMPADKRNSIAKQIEHRLANMQQDIIQP